MTTPVNETASPGEAPQQEAAVPAPTDSPATPDPAPEAPRGEHKAHRLSKMMKEEPVTLLLGFGVLYLVVAKAVSTWRVEGGGLFGFVSALGSSYGTIVVLFMGVGFVLILFRESVHAAIKAWGPYAVGLVLGPLALWAWVGAYNWVRDILIAVGVFVCVILFRRRAFAGLAALLEKTEPWLERHGRRGLLGFNHWGQALLQSPAWCRCLSVLSWLAITWVLGSIANVYLGTSWGTASKPFAADPQRFVTLSGKLAKRNAAYIASGKPPEPPRLGLALSGGGFRAALMHAGVLAALEDLGIPVAGLATVSGGSIIGGYYMLGGNPTDFRDAVAGARFNLKRDLMDAQNLPRLPCPGHVPVIDVDLLWFCSHSRIDAQADLLDRVLFSGKRVDDLRRDRQREGDWWTRPPWWVIGATDLLRGEGIGISADGIFRRAHATPARELHTAELRRDPSAPLFHELFYRDDFRNRHVSQLVAVSGAFPGAFGSTEFEIVSGLKLQIVDGGITDNLGYSLLASAVEQSAWRRRDLMSPLDAEAGDWNLDMIIVSDGGMPLSRETTMPAYLEFVRAMDVVYASAGIAVARNGVQKIWLAPRSIRIAELGEQDLRRIPQALRVKRGVGDNLGKFKEDLERMEKMFRATSTLQDGFEVHPIAAMQRAIGRQEAPPFESKDAVGALFDLGQYLVYLNACEIGGGLEVQLAVCGPPTTTAAIAAR